MNVKESFRYRDRFFSLVYILYALLSVISWSQFSLVYSGFNKLYLAYQIFCIPCLMILYVETKPTSKVFLLYILLTMFSVYCSYVVHNMMFVLFVLFFFAAKNIDYRSLIKKDIVVKIVLFIVILLSYKVGFLHVIGTMSRATGKIRETLGFNYPTYVMYIVMLIEMEWMIIRNKNISYLELIFISIIGYYFGTITDARGEKFILLFVVVGVFLLKLTNFQLHKVLKNKFIKYFLILLPEIAGGVSYLVINFLKSSSPLYGEINQFFSWRINIIQLYYQNYGVKVFPTKVVLNYVGDEGKWVQVIDNIYLYLGIELGIIALLIYLGIASFLMNNAIKNENWILILIIVGFVILNLTEYVTLAPAIAIYCIMWKKQKEDRKVKVKYDNEPCGINHSTNI